MSYTDQEIILDRQKLIQIAENSDYGVCVKHFNGVVIVRKLKSEKKMYFYF